jgi:predicted trehalose synthase
MTTTAQRRAAAEKIKAAEDACEELRSVLTGFGVKLPSLHVDLASCTGDTPRPLLDLGRCTTETAVALTAALRTCEQ